MSKGSDDFAGVETYRLPGPERKADEPRRFLLVLDAAAPRVIELAPGSTLRLGRAPDCEVVLADRAVSRQHAVVHVGAVIEVQDLGSANGIVVAGQSCPPGTRVALPVGSTLEIGGTLLVLHAGAVPPQIGPIDRAAEPEPSMLRIESVVSEGQVVADDAMARLYEVVTRVAPTRLNVLLLGETGVGKEVIATALHERSTRARGPIVRVNCAAIAGQLLDSELFGHERGAFTGADRARRGLVEEASSGTLLLDEIGELPLTLQAKLLRVIEAQEVRPIGATAPRPVDVRYIAATNRDLEAEVARGTFRRDLYHRLNGIRLEIPPLRRRKSEIVPLAEHFLAQLGAPRRSLSQAAVERLIQYPWPGNVRELRNAVEHAAALCPGTVILPAHLPPGIRGDVEAAEEGDRITEPMDLREDLAAIEKQRIVEALERCDGNQTRAAKLLGMPRRTLISRIEQYGLPRPRKGKR